MRSWVVSLLAAVVVVAVAAAIAFVVSPGLWEALLFSSERSKSYAVHFSWNRGIETIRVVDLSTGGDESRGYGRELVLAEAKKLIPGAVAPYELERARGVLYCSVPAQTVFAICGAPGYDTGAIVDPDAETPLMKAAKRGDYQRVAALLASGANANEKDQYGRTVLMQAVPNEDVRVAELLLRAGADPNAADRNGWTALMAAASQGNERLVRMLLQGGASLRPINSEGMTAEMIAKRAGHSRMARLLRVKAKE